MLTASSLDLLPNPVGHPLGCLPGKPADPHSWPVSERTVRCRCCSRSSLRSVLGEGVLCSPQGCKRQPPARP